MMSYKYHGICVLLAGQILIGTAASADDKAVENGEEIFLAKCDYCHGSGIQKGATMRLEERYQGSVPALLKDRTDLTAELITTFVRTATLGMAPFRLTEINDSELEDLIAYLTRNNPD